MILVKLMSEKKSTGKSINRKHGGIGLILIYWDLNLLFIEKMVTKIKT